MEKSPYRFEFLGNLTEGKFQRTAEVHGEWRIKSPADESDELGTIQYSYRAIDDAVQSARAAFESWRKLSFQQRLEFVKKYQANLKKREPHLLELLSREVGKTGWDAQQELDSMHQGIDTFTQGQLAWSGDLDIPNLFDQTRGACHQRPVGVMAVITAFEAPCATSNSHIVPALLAGNTLIYKPSEKAAAIGQVLSECAYEAGFPAGVFNLIQGEREVGRRLCVHEGIQAILFSGSYEVGTRIKQDTLQQHWKLLVLEMGGKNATLVWEDTDLNVAVLDTLLAAFSSAGQRCNSTSRILVHEKCYDQFLSQFHERAKAFSIAHPLTNPFMGPLIDSSSMDRYMKFQGIANREGFETVMRGKLLELPKKGNYVTPSICAARDLSVEQSKKSIYQQTEIFAPNVAIVGVKTLEEAIAQANATQYGLVTSVYTKDRDIFQKCNEDLETGMIYWNQPTVRMSPRLPKLGLKKSGNYFSGGLNAARYCTFPVSSLEKAETKMTKEMILNIPGLNWKE